jgi:hypothetical protein
MGEVINAENILFTFGMFAILMVAYGQTIAAADVQTNMNNLFAGWPSFQQTVQALTGPSKNCGIVDFGCQASAGVATATAYIGAVFAYPAILAGSLLSRISSFGNLLGLVTFGPVAAVNTIPYGNLFLLALFLVVIILAFKLFRGNPSGL